MRRKNPSQFLTGDLALFERLINEAGATQFKYRIIMVQPGMSRSGLSAKQGALLAMASDYVARANCEELLVLASD